MIPITAAFSSLPSCINDNNSCEVKIRAGVPPEEKLLASLEVLADPAVAAEPLKSACGC